MTVSSALSRKEYTGDAVTTSFSTSPVEFFETSNLTVYVVVTATGVSETLTENTHYTVSGGDGATGTVNLAGGTSPYGAPAATKTVVIQRTVPRTQQTDFVQNDGSDAEVTEEALDRLVMITQEHDTTLDRVFKLADSDVSGVSLDMPTPAASELIGFNSGATALTTYPAASIASTIIPTAFAETLLDDSTAAEARTTLDAMNDPLTTAGDVVYATAANTAARLGIGTARQQLAVNSGATAPEWVASLQSLMTGTGDIVQSSGANTPARLAIGTARQVPTVNAGATALAYANPITITAEQASTSGTSIDFTGIPAGVRRITIMFRGVSTNGTSNYLVQIGDAGGFENSGYLGSSGAGTFTRYTTGFGIQIANASNVVHGVMTLNLQDASDFTWMAHGVFGLSDSDSGLFSAGSKSLSAALTQVRCTTVNGTDAFDAGAISISYE